ncbi:unnamed protein product, partial [Choristocarpus tenellus]
MSSGTIDDNRLDNEKRRGSEVKKELGRAPQGVGTPTDSDSKVHGGASVTAGTQEPEVNNGSVSSAKVGKEEQNFGSKADRPGSAPSASGKEIDPAKAKHARHVSASNLGSNHLFSFHPVITQVYPELNQGMTVDVAGPVRFTDNSGETITTLLSQTPIETLDSQLVNLRLDQKEVNTIVPGVAGEAVEGGGGRLKSGLVSQVASNDTGHSSGTGRGLNGRGAAVATADLVLGNGESSMDGKDGGGQGSASRSRTSSTAGGGSAPGGTGVAVGGHSPLQMSYTGMPMPLSVGMMGQGGYGGGVGVNTSGSALGQMGMPGGMGVGMHQSQGGHTSMLPGVLSAAMGAHMGHMDPSQAALMGHGQGSPLYVMGGYGNVGTG